MGSTALASWTRLVRCTRIQKIRLPPRYSTKGGFGRETADLRRELRELVVVDVQLEQRCQLPDRGRQLLELLWGSGFRVG